MVVCIFHASVKTKRGQTRLIPPKEDIERKTFCDYRSNVNIMLLNYITLRPF